MLVRAETRSLLRRVDGGRAHAVVIGSRARPALICVQSLGAAGHTVLVVDDEPGRPGPAAFSRWTGGYARIPNYSEDPDSSTQALLELLRSHRPDVLIPTMDRTVDMLDRERTHLEPLTGLALADRSALDATVDKQQTLDVARSLGIPVPEGVAVSSVADAAAAGHQVGYPAVVKPAISWTADSWRLGRLACQIAVDSAELTAAVEQVLAGGGTPIVQPWLCGDREAVSLFMTREGTWARFAQVALRMYPPLGGTSVLRESISLPADLLDASERLLRRIGYEGYAEVEFRRDAQGVPRLMEVNPRLSASVGIASAAGIDFPGYLYAWRAGLRLQQDRGYRSGIRMRWLGGDLRWLVDTLQHPGRPDALPPGAAASTFVRDFASKTRYDYVERRDLRPAAHAVSGLVTSRWAALAHNHRSRPPVARGRH